MGAAAEAAPSQAQSPPRQPASAERHRTHAGSVKQLISQKRDVSYVQLALDLKRSQIQRLEAFAAQRAATLQKAEGELEADAAQFDDFLRRNDGEVQVAVRRADQQACIRQDKVGGWLSRTMTQCPHPLTVQHMYLCVLHLHDQTSCCVPCRQWRSSS